MRSDLEGKGEVRWMVRLAPSSEGVLGQWLSSPLAWLELTKPRIGLFVILAAFTGGLLAAGPSANLPDVLIDAIRRIG